MYYLKGLLVIMELLFVSSNRAKYQELKQIIPNLELYSLDIPEYQGSHEEIVRGKCLYAYNILKRPLIVEDSALSFQAWKGMPGPYIKPFMEHNTCEDIFNLLVNMNKEATATCIIGYIDGRGIQLFTGSTMGKIVAPIGDHGFSWDPIFEANGQPKGSFATLTIEEKLKYSPRNRAALLLQQFLN